MVYCEDKKFKPFTIENELGKFTMRHNLKKEPLYMYKSTISWQGKENSIDVWVECDDKETFSADKGFARLSNVLEKSSDWDARLRKFAMNFAVKIYGIDNGMIKVWNSVYFDSGEKTKPIPPEEFAEHISIAGITVWKNGELEFDIDIDGLFVDHWLSVHADKNGNII